jgi:polar amino acid transport system substrate-binding protein
MYTEQLPPYSYRENGTVKGITIDILGAVSAKTGTKFSPELVHILPWEKAYQAATAGRQTVLFSTARIPERENLFQWVGPISTERYVLFAGRDTNLTIDKPEDLTGLRIGAGAGDAAGSILLDLGVDESRIVTGNNVSELITKLESGQIDLWASPEYTGRYYTEQVTGNYYTYRVVYPLREVDIYYAFSRDVPDSTVRSYQKALDSLKEEKDDTGISTYERIFGRYIPSTGLSHLQYLTEEWPPFNYQKDGIPAGISVEILEAVFRNLEVNRTRKDIRVVPLSEGFRQAQGNNSTVLFSIVRSPEREPLYQWAGPFTKAGFVVFAPVSRSITIHSPEDLAGYRIGAVQDTIENTLLANQGVHASQIIPGLVPADCIRMLEEGEIDLWATGDITGKYEMKTVGVDPDAYEIVYTLSENDFYFIFSRDVPEILIRAFTQGLAAVRNQKDSRGISEYERIIYQNIGIGCTRQSFSDESVVALVNRTAREIERDASATFRHINAGEDPYRDAKNPERYVFVYDTNLTLVAHADNPLLIGVPMQGKTDVTGKPLHDKILEGALRNGTGWEEYVYMNPVQTNLYHKTTYYQLTKGSDGRSYIVGSGNFKICKA